MTAAAVLPAVASVRQAEVPKAEEPQVQAQQPALELRDPVRPVLAQAEYDRRLTVLAQRRALVPVHLPQRFLLHLPLLIISVLRIIFISFSVIPTLIFFNVSFKESSAI